MLKIYRLSHKQLLGKQKNRKEQKTAANQQKPGTTGTNQQTTQQTQQQTQQQQQQQQQKVDPKVNPQQQNTNVAGGTTQQQQQNQQKNAAQDQKGIQQQQQTGANTQQNTQIQQQNQNNQNLPPKQEEQKKPGITGTTTNTTGTTGAGTQNANQQPKGKTEKDQILDLKTEVNDLILKYNKQLQDYEYLRQKEQDSLNIEQEIERLKIVTDEVISEEQQKIQNLRQQVILKRADLAQKKLQSSLLQKSSEADQRVVLNEYQASLDKESSINNSALKDLQTAIPKLKSQNINNRAKVVQLDEKKKDNDDLIQARKDYLFTQEKAMDIVKQKIAKLEPFQQKVNQTLASAPQGKVSRIQLQDLQNELDQIAGVEKDSSQVLLGKLSSYLANEVEQRRQIAEMRKTIVATNVKNVLKKEQEQLEKVNEELQPIANQSREAYEKCAELRTLVEQKAKMVELMKEDNDKLRETMNQTKVKQQQLLDETDLRLIMIDELKNQPFERVEEEIVFNMPEKEVEEYQQSVHEIQLISTLKSEKGFLVIIAYGLHTYLYISHNKSLLEAAKNFKLN
ncbi:UNKNOWN [Stylonychia lemnae]|uniref:Uncharacterized protein n=1 Tax=Stylonychia lemnae TaxID=5949 RepID=A0A077ZZ02_STYLE|nr:UNKNOWN [Stylonychia lemnae]|eukprot:CDW75186.1 UNKNOWN [Stylonychia lemnae]